MASYETDEIDQYVERKRTRKNQTLATTQRKRLRRGSRTPGMEASSQREASLGASLSPPPTNGKHHEQGREIGEDGIWLRDILMSEVPSLLKEFDAQPSPSVSHAIAERKLKLAYLKSTSESTKPVNNIGRTVTPLEEAITETPHPSPEVFDALLNIRTTPFESSFLSRLQGTRALPYTVIAVDWETETPWISLMNDIREHHAILHPDRESSTEDLAPIMYTTLQPFHLQQVHDLLERVFWTGINVADSLDHSPEQCTVVAMYKRLVVGIAILSSPRETYITYLAVRAGWDNSGIARSMLYHLITMNPHKDITLHVSVNSPAMLLYNQFGFKAEEFVAGFYEEYMDRNSCASKNAFRLRLRQQ